MKIVGISLPWKGEKYGDRRSEANVEPELSNEYWGSGRRKWREKSKEE